MAHCFRHCLEYTEGLLSLHLQSPRQKSAARPCLDIPQDVTMAAEIQEHGTRCMSRTVSTGSPTADTMWGLLCTESVEISRGWPRSLPVKEAVKDDGIFYGKWPTILKVHKTIKCGHSCLPWWESLLLATRAEVPWWALPDTALGSLSITFPCAVCASEAVNSIAFGPRLLMQDVSSWASVTKSILESSRDFQDD